MSLTKQILSAQQKYGFSTSLCIAFRGETLGIDSNVPIECASTRKVIILAAVLSGDPDLSRRVGVTDVVSSHYNTGVLQYLDAQQLTLKDLLTLMIIVSDSTAANICGNLVGGIDGLNAYITKIGLKDTRFNDLYLGNQSTISTTADMTKLLFMIHAYDPILSISKQNCDLIFEIMSHNQLRTRIPSMIPVSVANKTGTGYSSGKYIINDVGIVLSTGLIISIFVSGVDWDKIGYANLHIGKLARICYDYTVGMKV